MAYLVPVTGVWIEVHTAEGVETLQEVGILSSSRCGLLLLGPLLGLSLLHQRLRAPVLLCKPEAFTCQSQQQPLHFRAADLPCAASCAVGKSLPPKLGAL